MKLVNYLNGVAAIKTPVDDIRPEAGVLQRKVIQLVGDAYEFSGRPPMPEGEGNQAQPMLWFHGGRLKTDQNEYVIQQIVLYQDGIAVSTATTDIAEIVLADTVKRLDEGLGYRFKSVERWRQFFVNSLVVQFDVALEDQIPALNAIESILSAKRDDKRRYKPKTLTFGFGDPTSQPSSIDAMDSVDFSLQRRIGETYESNRYFASAALRTSEHLAVLEEIERTISRPARG